MKNFRQMVSSALITITAFSAVVYASCNKNKCGSVVCQNGGICNENVCACAAGYSGNSCENSWSTEYIGLYSCTKTCIPAVGAGTWQSDVAADATDGGYTITISNFDNTVATVYATVDSANHISIVPAAGTAGITGTGTYSATGNGVITLRYSATAVGGQSGYSCTMILTKL